MRTMKIIARFSSRVRFLPVSSTFFLLALMSVLALNACQQIADSAPPGADPKISSLLRHTKLPGLPSEKAQPLTRYMGKSGLLLVFVDTSCPYSNKAMKDLPVVAPALAAHNIPTVLINLDDGIDKVRTHYAEQNQIGRASCRERV